MDKDDYIVEIVCGGAKTYAHRTLKGKQVVKLKGVTLDRTNGDIFTFEKLEDMVLNNEVLTSAPRHQFITNELTKNIETRMLSKNVICTVDSKRCVVNDFETAPFGWMRAVEVC